MLRPHSGSEEMTGQERNLRNYVKPMRSSTQLEEKGELWTSTFVTFPRAVEQREHFYHFSCLVVSSISEAVNQLGCKRIIYA
jgi:hypothetical protein